MSTVCLTAGTFPTSGIEFVKELEEKMKTIGAGKIATVMGVIMRWTGITGGSV